MVFLGILSKGASYLTARLEVLSLGEDALVVVDVVLPAVLGLVLVRKASIEAWGLRVRPGKTRVVRPNSNWRIAGMTDTRWETALGAVVESEELLCWELTYQLRDGQC